MFCPNCKAEYREGFTRCSDCDVDLAELLAIDSDPPEFARRDSNRFHFLAWFLPMLALICMFVLVTSSSGAAQKGYVVVPTLALLLASNIGGFWMLHQAIRYEKKPLPYVVLAFVPFYFCWYFLARYRHRNSSQIPIAFQSDI